MQRRKYALIACLTFMVSIVVSLSIVGLVGANYYPPSSIEFYSPISAPKVYNESSVQLSVRVNVLPSESSRITYINYCLDGKANVTLTNLTRENGLYYWTNTEGVFAYGNAFSAETSLDNLTEGKHTLIVYSHAADNTEMSKTREFTVDFNYVPPQVSPSTLPNASSPAMAIVSPLPVNYENSSVPLNFGANVWIGAPEITSLSYSLDGNENVTITDIGKTGIQNFGSQAGYTYHIKGGFMLNDLADGTHTLWVYSRDASGNEMSGSVEFTVDTNNQPFEDNIFSLQILALLTIVTVAVVLSIVFVLRKKRSNSQEIKS